ncbi:MAG: alpha/beta fold hydrolase [Pseudomonadota bacterium]
MHDQTGAAGLRDKVAFPVFRQRPPWLGGDLQTLRNQLLPFPPRLSPWPGERLELAMADGSGDRLVARLHRPLAASGRPLVVLIHGLTGCEDSYYILRSARHLLGLGYPVLRLNLRGAGPSRPLCRWQYHAGRSEDLRDALNALDSTLKDAGLLLVGYSLGGNMLIKFLAEFGQAFPIRAAAAISAPLDLKDCQICLEQPRNWIYQYALLRRMKIEAQAGAAELTGEERRAIRAARREFEFDEFFVAKRAGFEGADSYYRHSSAQAYLAEVPCSTLVLHARDDPWIPVDAYERFDWSCNPNLTLLLSDSGGHLGFHQRGPLTPWHDTCLARYFAAFL